MKVNRKWWRDISGRARRVIRQRTSKHTGITKVTFKDIVNYMKQEQIIMEELFEYVEYRLPATNTKDMRKELIDGIVSTKTGKIIKCTSSQANNIIRKVKRWKS